MNAKISAFVICVKEIIYLLLNNLHDCTFNWWLAFFLFRCEFQKKIEPSWRNYLIWSADWGGNTPDTQNTFIIFLSAIVVTRVIVWTEDNFCFTSDYRNSFNCKLKNFINEQIIVPTVFLLKTLIWTWIFFQYCRVLSLKTEKIFSKKDASQVKITWNNKRQKQNIEKRDRKNKIRKSQTTTVSIFLKIFFI